MSTQLDNSIAQSLMSLGLYTVAFESMVLTFKAQMHGYLTRNQDENLKTFKKDCLTANKTLRYCEPRLVSLGVLTQDEIDSLKAMRENRNVLAHEGYNQMLKLTISDVQDDVILMARICKKVENWNQVIREANPDGSQSFYVVPSIFALYLKVAQQLAQTILSIPASDTTSDVAHEI